MSESNSDAVKAEIARLRAERRAQLGIIKRREMAVDLAKGEIRQARWSADECKRKIIELGGKVRS